MTAEPPPAGGLGAALVLGDDPARARAFAISASVEHLKSVKNREQLEHQWDKWLALHKVEAPTRFDAQQRRDLRKFFQVMDADSGGTIDVSELESPMLSTGLVTNYRELHSLMQHINASGQGEITFWEFLTAFKPPAAAGAAAAGSPPRAARPKAAKTLTSPGGGPPVPQPDMAHLRLLLATAEHETLSDAFQRDHDDDGLSDAEEPVVALYAKRAEESVRARHRATGDPLAASHWFERLYYKRAGAGAPAPRSFATKKQVEAARTVTAAAAEAAALKRDSHLTLGTRIGLHRRRFLLATIMQQKERHAGKRADLNSALRSADARRDAPEATALREALHRLEIAHGRRMERLAATALVVDKDRGRSAGAGDAKAAGAAAATRPCGDGDVDGGDDGDDDDSSSGGGGGGGATALDERAVAAALVALEGRTPRFTDLMNNCARFIASAEAAKAAVREAEALADGR